MEFGSMELSDNGLDPFPSMPLICEGGEKNEEPVYYRGSPRVVFFDEEVKARRVRPVYQIGGPIDRRELWYQDDEYKEIMWKARRLVKRAYNDEDNTHTEKYCLRGLEHVTNSIKRRIKTNLDGRDAVLDEQCLQFREDVFPLDDDKIASVYLPYTKAHRFEAIERAKFDAEEVELYQKQTSSSASSAPPSMPIHHSNSNSSRSSLSLSTHKSKRRPSLSGSFSSPTSPLSPSLSNKPGMMFTKVNKTTQYPAGMRLQSL
jgi:hypothetical protein